MKKYLIICLLVLYIWNISFANNTYQKIIVNMYKQYWQIFNNNFVIKQNNTNTNNNNTTTTNNNNKKNKFIKVKLWVWKYKEKIDEENYQRNKKINNILNKYIIWSLNVKSDLNKVLFTNIDKLKRNDAILIYLKFNTQDFFTFNNLNKTLVVLPYKIKINKKVNENLFIIQNKINNIFKNNNEIKQLKQLKTLLNKFKIRFIIVNNIINSNKTFQLYIWQKLSFYNKMKINLISSSYFSINNTEFIKNKDIWKAIKILNKSWNFYLWGVITEKEIKNLFENNWQNTFNRNNLISYLSYNWIWLVLNWQSIKNNNLQKEDFYTLQFFDKIWGHNINTIYYYTFYKNYNYIIYIIISIIFWIISAIIIFKLYYFEKIKKILSQWSDKI